MKITSTAQPNQILAGQSVFDVFASDGVFRNKFTNVKLPYDKWNYIDKSSGNIYELYSMNRLIFSLAESEGE